MSTIPHVVGIDPGLVHTGCVRLQFDALSHTIELAHNVANGLDVVDVTLWTLDSALPEPHIFIEDYRPRHNLAPDRRMVEGVASIHRALPGSVKLSNTGITKVIPTALMALLGAWNWPTVTHHQDLRSAARIALLGMVKTPSLNRVLSATVEDHLAGNTWRVVHP